MSRKIVAVALLVAGCQMLPGGYVHQTYGQGSLQFRQSGVAAFDTEFVGRLEEGELTASGARLLYRQGDYSAEVFNLVEDAKHSIITLRNGSQVVAFLRLDQQCDLRLGDGFPEVVSGTGACDEAMLESTDDTWPIVASFEFSAT